jgi:probable F420-dependent oxidoreductase
MTSSHPIRFAVGADPLGAEDMAAWRRLAIRAEALGYSSVLTGDHFLKFLPAGGAAPLLALADAAAATTTLRVGTVVLGNDYRHPAVLAKDAATLDVLTEGRLELGIGAGWYEPEYAALGLPFDPPGVRIDRLAEALEILTRCWSGETFDFVGDHYTITGYAATPLPFRPGGPAILVGGGSAKVLRIAGRYGDIVGIHPSTAATDAIDNTTFENTAKKIGWVREGAGGRFGGIELQMACSFTITDGSERALDEVAERMGTTAGRMATSAMFMVGDLPQIIEQIRRRRDELGISYFIVPSTVIEEFAPVVAALAGTTQ